MKELRKRLLTINLAILLLITMVIPAYAEAESQEDKTVRTAMASCVADSEIEKTAELESAQAVLTSNPVWPISVNGTTVDRSRNMSGTGWYYSSASDYLYLTNYSGGGIYTSGDLNIYMSGTNVITGANGQYGYGSSGLSADNLTIDVYGDSKLTIQGGYGSVSGGDGINAGILCVYGSQPSTVTNFSVTGGSSSSSSGSAGYGVCAGTVYLNANCKISGGNAASNSSAVYFTDYFEVGAYDITMSCGTGTYAITSPGGRTWYYDGAHSYCSATSQKVTITPYTYTVTFNGNGGTWNGKSSFSFSHKYGVLYWLKNYTFQRTGYVQVMWGTASPGDLVPSSPNELLSLSSWYIPGEDIGFFPIWQELSNDSVVLIAQNSLLDNDNYFKRYTNESFVLPTSTHYKNGTYASTLNQIAWTDQAQASAMELCVYPGVWYEAGSTLSTATDGGKGLYSFESGGNYVFYHATDGTVTKDGNIVVQGGNSSDDLTVYALGEDYFTAPKGGYELAGWSTSPNSNTVQYKVGQQINVPYSDDVMNLYAVWKPNQYTQELSGQEITISRNPNNKSGSLYIKSSWCQAHGATQFVLARLAVNGRPIAYKYIKYSGSDIELTWNYTATDSRWVVLAMDSSCRPICNKMEYNLISS